MHIEILVEDNSGARLPEETMQEDEKLLTLYDMALTRTEANA